MRRASSRRRNRTRGARCLAPIFAPRALAFQYGVDLLPKGSQDKGSLGERSGLIQGAGVVGALVSRMCHALAK